MKLTARRRLVIPTVVAVAVAGAGAALLARHGSAGSEQYRTAVASLGSVTQTIALSGNLAPVGETDLDFGSSGKVTAIDVHPGEAVTAGQALASIDAGALQAALTQAQATLASAQARQSLDQAGPSAQALAQAQASVRSAQSQVQSAQTALVDTQQVDQSSIAQAQAALSAAQAKLSADQSACSAAPAATASASPSASPSPAPSPTPNPSCGLIQGDTAAVSAAKAGVSAAQAKAQQSEHQAQGQLSSAQVQLQNAQDGLTTQQQGTSTQQVAMDQSQVQVDQVNVDNARTALTQATLAAPVAGVVGQVNLTLGQTTGGSTASSTGSSGSGGGSNAGSASGSGSSSSGSSASTTHAIVILTPGAFEVVGSVSDLQVNQIAVGQAASVSVAGTNRTLTGKVTNIAAVATVTSGVATFPVTVVLDGANQGLHAGVSASIAVVIDQVSDVLTVPTSAIHRAGGASTVQTLVNGQPVSGPVTIGATNSLRTQVLSGVNPGDTVVIASVTSAVPTPNVNSFLGGGGGRGTGGTGRGGTGRAAAGG